MASESILCITYFDTVLGPNIFYCSAPLNKVEHPDLGRILEFSEAEGSFIFTYRKFQTINHIFSIDSEYARGGKEILMITFMIRAAYFKDEITDVYNFLLSKTPNLENFASDIKKLKELTSVIHSNKWGLAFVMKLARGHSSFILLFTLLILSLCVISCGSISIDLYTKVETSGDFQQRVEITGTGMLGEMITN
ncbi:MAG: hypothetical protein ACFE9R_16985, partial [Candidatus Hermodarchaeota archaeon]